MVRFPIAGTMLATGMVFALSACDDIQNIPFLQSKDSAESASDAPAATGAATTRDVEAPDVFEASEAGLWDGRPSLGGVWVAHPDVTDPEKVIIRNEANGKSVIGALFRRERQNPGPKLQVSSDAAASLELLAGAPTDLYVVALREEEVPPAPVISPEAVADTAPTEDLQAPDTIETATLDPIASAAAAIDAAESDAADPVITPAEDSPQMSEQDIAPAPRDPQPVETAATDIPDLTRQSLPVSPLKKPFIQIGIFSVEANANTAAKSLRANGIVPTVLAQESRGKKFWRVVVGPATTTGERGDLQDKVRKLGYEDAYFVTN